VYRARGGTSPAGRVCLCRVWRTSGVAAEVAPAGVRMCNLPPAGNRRPPERCFHRTRTDLTKWFLAAYLMGRDKRGISAKFLQRELGVAYQTAWTMAHKLRYGLSEDPSRPLHGFLEADETFIRGRGDPTSLGRSTANPDKSLVVAAVEKVPAPKNRSGKHGHAIKRQHGFFAGDARIAVLPAATGAELRAFLKANVARQFASADRRVCRPSWRRRRSR
jgi:hypothetical protein